MLKRSLALIFGAAFISIASLSSAQQGIAQDGYIQAPGDSNVLIPVTSIARPGDAGHTMHTNHMIYIGSSQGPIDPFAQYTPTHLHLRQTGAFRRTSW